MSRIRSFADLSVSGARVARHMERFPAIQRGVTPSNIDGFVSVDGHFLFIEYKLAGQQVCGGQLYSLCDLAMLPRSTVLIVWQDAESEALVAWGVLLDPEVPDKSRVEVVGHNDASLIDFWLAWGAHAAANAVR